MKKQLLILHLEDSALDGELLEEQLGNDYSLSVKRVDSEMEFEHELTLGGFELIISDFTLPSYNGMRALALACELRPEVPFIFFSGTIGEEAAVETLRNGATDYVLKHRPQKLLAAVERALREKAERAKRVEAEAALKQREKWFRTLIENALDIITVLDARGKFTYNSPSIERVLGYAPDELLQHDAFALVHPEDYQKARASFDHLLQFPNEAITAEYRLRHKDGSWRQMELIGKELLAADGAAGVVINSRDVTEKREIESRFLRAQRLECLGVLAGGVAHDLNNILSPVLMGADLLGAYLSDPEALAILEMIKASSERGSDIVRQILSFARGARGQASPIKIDRVVMEVAKLVRETFPKTIQVQTHVPSELPQVVCNPTELHQVLINLCVNARDAMPEGGLLQIAASAHELSSEQKLKTADHGAESFIRLTVADTGTGISPDVLPRIFEPFFTTKEEGRGTGLGLATVLSIVKRSGGFTEVESVLGEGTRFHLYFPTGTRADTAEPISDAIPRGNRQLILMVDDESAILELARFILEDANYRVVLAAEGVHGLREFHRLRGEVDLVVTDSSMPVMDGAGLIRELRRISPGVRILGATGGSAGAERERLLACGANGILAKPYSAQQLLGAVAETMAARP